MILFLSATTKTTITCQSPHAPWWHIPVGIFAVLSGLAAVAVALSGELSRREKVIWILGISVLTLLELRMIIWSDADAAKERAYAECELQKNFQQIETDSQMQFDQTMSGVGKVFTKTEQAADTAREGVNTITGGDGFSYIDLAEMFTRGRHSDQIGTMLEVRNAKIVWHVSMRVLDYQAFKKDSEKLSGGDIESGQMLNLDAVTTYLGDLKDGPTPLFNSIGINKAYQADRDYIIQFWALNGAWNEEIHSRTVGGKMVKAIRVARLVFPKDWDTAKVTFKPLYERVDEKYPRTNGQVGWVDLAEPKQP
jgi:hypothetical protein